LKKSEKEEGGNQKKRKKRQKNRKERKTENGKQKSFWSPCLCQQLSTSTRTPRASGFHDVQKNLYGRKKGPESINREVEL